MITLKVTRGELDTILDCMNNYICDYYKEPKADDVEQLMNRLDRDAADQDDEK